VEEDTIDLSDCLSVIWKRKILIIVGSLVCMIFVVVMGLRDPVVHRAESTIRIGTIVNTSGVRVPIKEPEDLVRIIPVDYAFEDEEASGYSLGAEVVPGALFIHVAMSGPNIGKVKELLRKVSEKIVKDQNSVTETTIQFYMDSIERSTKSMKKAMEINEKTNAESGVNKTDPFLLELTIQNILDKREAMMFVRDEVFRNRLIVDDLKRNKTRQVGGIREVVVRKSKISKILIAGFAGLAMSIFLAFIIEFLGNVIEKEKRKSMS
jgi:hypothetical protein